MSRTTNLVLVAAALLALVTHASPSGAQGVPAPPPAIDPQALERASVGGKYADLLGTVEIPDDVRTYGEFHDYGPWGGGTYRGIPNLPAGHWVYVAPRWYIWRTLAPVVPAPSPAPSPAPAPAEARKFPEEPSDTHDPRRPRLLRGPDLDGPLGPVHRYMQGKKIGIGRVDLDPAAGYLVPVIRPSRGGFLFAAVRDDRTDADRDIRDRDGNRVYMAGKTVPLLVKLDAAGDVEWVRSHVKKGFVDYGPGLVAEARNGNYLVAIPSYVHPGRSPVHRFLSVRPTTGEVVWERQLRGSGGRNSPLVEVARLTDRGTLALEGHIYLVPDDSTRNYWKGEIGADGRLLLDRAGPVAPRAGDGPVRAMHRYDRGRLHEASAGPSYDFPEIQRAYQWARRDDVVLANPDRHVAPRLGWMIPVIQLSRGGTILVGVRIDASEQERAANPHLAGQTRPVVVKLDAQGRPEWERSLEAPRFDGYGGGLALEAPDGGAFVMIPSYVLGSWGYAARFLRIGPSGEVLWERTLPAVEATGRSPEVEKVRLSERGTLVIRGHAYADATYRKIHVYDGEIDPKGRLLVHLVGPVRPKPGTMQVVGPDGRPIGGAR
ncbi:MAG TPA: hypothetical protein VLS93_10305 [Anaeromyxobacteraceae bacterium]|nr:hypothetical protein [Anaeromyxobacteraceae bacterium]